MAFGFPFTDTDGKCLITGFMQMIAFWSLYLSLQLTILLPLNIIMTCILVHEKNANGLFVMAWDRLAMMYILNLSGARPDAHVEAVCEDGMPGTKFMIALKNTNRAMLYYVAWWPLHFCQKLTGYTPSIMTLTPSAENLQSLYTLRVLYMDNELEKRLKAGSVDQVLIMKPGWDFRAKDLAKKYPKVRFIEFDLAGMQTCKLESCKAYQINYDQIILSPNALAHQGDVLDIRSRVDMQKRTFIICEESMYLGREVVESMVLMLKELPVGSSMALDVWMNRKTCSLNPMNWQLGRCFTKCAMKTMLKHLLGEPVKFSLDLVGLDQEMETLDAFVHSITKGDVIVTNRMNSFIGACATIQSN